MNELLLKQIMADYSCTRQDILDNKNHFTVYRVNQDRRKYQHIEQCKLRMIIVNSKLIFTGVEDIVKAVEKEFSNTSGQWMLEPMNMYALGKLLADFGQGISIVHPYYIAEQSSEVNGQYNIAKYNQQQLKQFVDDDRFDEAFGGDEDTPDVLACSISDSDKIVAMAGASIDSPYMMQIGINVAKEYQNKGFGTALVATIANDILKMGYLPYYGTSFSHLASQKVALHAGFKLSFVELFTKPL